MKTPQFKKWLSVSLMVRDSKMAGVPRPFALTVLLLGAALLYEGCSTTPVPPDPITTGPDSCTLAASEFNTWFETGAVSLDGVAKPANSVTFANLPNCSFYKWSEQMFIWLTSPAPPSYGGGGGRIFNSPAFFDVSPLDTSGNRTLIPHPPGLSGLRNLSLRAAQVGVQGLPVIMDKRGNMLEIQRPQFGPTGKQLVLNTNGSPVEVARITLGEKKRPVFFDDAGKVILGARPFIGRELQNTPVVAKFIIDRVPIFLDPFGNVVEVEQGQADGSILMAQNGSLVYYQTMVNDVYAYFLTGAKDGQITPGTQFPTSQADLDKIVTFAANAGPNAKTFLHPEALAIEVKSSWVEAASLPNPGSYVTLEATIPTYDQSNPAMWVPNGQKTALMALVGMHVVGSTAGHPEMIWATFEHKNNAPNASYTYTSATGPKTVNPDFTGAWLFCSANPNLSHLNEPHMREDSGNIMALPGFTISPSDTIRGSPWGAAAGVDPNPKDASIADSDSEIISINDNVRSMLDAADVRNNYIMTGATWTINGGAFNGNFGNPGNTAVVTGRAVGTSQMANTTMETYQQALDPVAHSTIFSSGSGNCFACHQSNQTGVSHVFPATKPLF